MGAIPHIRDFEDKSFDPFLADEIIFGEDPDPYTRIAELRHQASVHKGNYRVLLGGHPDPTTDHFDHYTVFGYDEVARCFEPDVFLNSAYKPNLGVAFGESVSTMDAPEHGRYRKIFQKAFLPHIVAKWGDTIVDPVVNELMAEFLSRGKADLVQEFTLHYPFRIVYKQLNLPPEDTKIFHKLAIAQTIWPMSMERSQEATRNLGEYFKNMVTERRKNPGDDLVSLLCTAEVDGEVLPENILISFFRQLVNAGGDTTYRATSVLLYGLLTNPDQLHAVRDDRSLIPAAIDEALRWDGPVINASRMTSRAITLAGVDIPAGAYINVVSGSANRDETKFPNPDKFDIFRKPAVRHFAFAFGPHVCIGQHLAKLEMTRALNAILDHLPNVRLDPDMPPPVIRGTMMRVPKHLHVVF